MSLLSNLVSTPARASIFACIFSVLVLGSVWAFELIGGYIPCPLCLEQRVPYYVIAPMAIMVYFLTPYGQSIPSRLGLLSLALLALYGAGLGVFQSGAEWGWWAGPAACGSGAGLSGGLPNFDTAKVIRCDEAQLRVLGLSFAGWNVITAVILAAGCLIGALSKRPQQS